MKIFILPAMIASTFLSFSALADIPSWKKGFLCGGYRSTTSGGVKYDSSKYNLLIGPVQKNSSKRRGVLFKNSADYSQAIAHTDQACVAKDEMLICNVDGVSVTIDTSSSAAQDSEVFSAKFYHPILITSRTGTCRVKDNADSDLDYYSQPASSGKSSD